jgi:hypothetical protein
MQPVLPDFSIFKQLFLVPLHADTFASQLLSIHPHWHQRCSLRGGRRICPSLNVSLDRKVVDPEVFEVGALTLTREIRTSITVGRQFFFATSDYQGSWWTEHGISVIQNFFFRRAARKNPGLMRPSESGSH